MTALRSKSFSLLMGALAAALGIVLLASCGDSDGDSGSDPQPDGSAGSGGTNPDAGTGGTGGTAGSAGSAGSAGTAGSGGTPAQGWDKSFALPGIQGPPTSTVMALAITPGRKLFVGGEFTHAGDVPAQNIAIWNGDKWMQAGAGLPQQVNALAETSDEKMYALTQDLSTGEYGIQFWDGTAWSAVPAANDGMINAIDVASDGTLYAAGSFNTIDGVAATHIAKRKNGTWSALGSGGPTDGIETVVVAGSNVCVGGGADAPQFGVVCFDGTSWSSRRANMEIGSVRTLTADANGVLYAGGSFMLTGQSGGGGLAKWTGTEWQLVGGGLLAEAGQPEVYSVKVDGQKVYAAGFFVLAGGLFVRHVAMWDGKKWNDMNGGLLKLMGIDLIEQARGRTFAIDDGGELYVGGRLTFAGSGNAMRIARWDGADWHAVDDPNAVRLGVNGNGLSAIYAASDGSVYAGGSFSYLGGNVAATGAARLDPVQGQWYALGAGLQSVSAFAEKDGSIYAVGGFTQSGSTSVKSIARWDGAAWQAVGGGLDGPANTIVRGPDGKLYVGGSFTQAGATAASNLAIWSGDSWAGVGSGIGAEGDSVRALLFDAGGKLYAGGSFTSAGGQSAQNIASWDGSTWAALGDGFDQPVQSLVLYQGKLVAGGSFSKSGASDALHVAQWDAAAGTWSTLGGGVLPEDEFSSVSIAAMAVHGTDLYVTGMFKKAGSVTVSHIARFDGTSWHDVESGVDDVANGLSVTDDSLWVAGTFTRAGDYGSIDIARYWFGP